MSDLSSGAVVPKDQLPKAFEFTPEPGVREAFQAGTLRDQWYRQHPQIFDEDCLRIATTQPSNHFNEWFGAIQIFERYGWLSLVEQYEFLSHPRKRKLVPRIIPDQEVAKFILMQSSGRRGRDAALTGQCPDLLCYTPDFSDWFFCEMKYPDEKLTSGQRALFPWLERISGQPIRAARVPKVAP